VRRLSHANAGSELVLWFVTSGEVFAEFAQRRFRVRLTHWAQQLCYRSVCALAGCGVIGRGPSSRVAILYFLADEPGQNHEQQDCRLIVEVHAPDGADIKWVHAEAEIAMEEKFGEGFALKPTTEQAASKYLEADPVATHGALNLATDVPLFYHLARIV
jgi:hypothetical protein